MPKLNQLFDIVYGSKFDLNKMILSKNPNEAVNFVGRSSQNNGVSAQVMKINGCEPFDAGLITVALGGSKLLSSFVQEKPFYTAQNVAVLTPKLNLTFAEKIYYCLCIRQNRFRYSAFGREANRTLRDLIVPSMEDIPSWIYSIKLEEYQDINATSLTGDNCQLETVEWHWFVYEELFDIERGRGPRKKDLSHKGRVPFVTSSDRNNGYTGFTEMPPQHPGNVITVARNGSVGESFYQPIPFCSTEDVHVFKPKFPMNRELGLFLATLIRREKYRFNYGRKWGLARMRASRIRLPATQEGKPDWGYMERFIKSLPYSKGLQETKEEI